MLPPMWLHLRFGTAEKPGTGLWLPLFLVWLILLPLVVFVLAITIVVDVVLALANQEYHYYTMLLLGCLGLLSETRGLVVRVHSDETDFDINFV